MSLPVVPEKPPQAPLPFVVRARQALVALAPRQLRQLKLATWLWIGAAVLLSVFFAWMLWPHAQSVEAAIIDRGEVRRDVVDEGRTRIHDVFSIAAPVSGALRRVTLEPGDTVTRGQTVATISPADPALLDTRIAAEAAATIAAAQSSLAAAEAQLGLAERDQVRVASLHAQGFASAAALDAANANLRSTRAQVAARQSEVRRARAASGAGGIARAPTPVRSPAAGQILRLLQQSEGVVAAGTPLMEIGDPRNLEIVAEFLSQDAVEMRPGAHAFIENWGGTEPIAAHVYRVEPYAHTKVSALGVEEQRVNVILRLDAPERAPPLGHAFRVDVRVVAADLPDTLRVRTDALIRSGAGGWAVFRVVDGRARLTPVRIGEGGDRYRAVVSGLSERDVIIVYPGDALKDGARVRSRTAGG